MLLKLPFSNRAVVMPDWFPALGPTKRVFIPPAGMGDSVMFSAVSENYWRQKEEPLFIATIYPEMFRHNPTAILASPRFRHILLTNRSWELALRRRRIQPISAKALNMTLGEDGAIRQLFPDCHFVARLCQRVGLSGKISLIPKIYLSREEKNIGRFFPANQIAIQSTGKHVKAPNAKDWGYEKMEEVVKTLRNQAKFVQIGVREDPLLEGVLDLRGLPLRQTAAILHNSDLFCGLVGGLMHLARAVNCRSVVAFTGAEPQTVDGYRGNIHVISEFGCTRCAQNELSVNSGDQCPAEYRCVTDIPVEEVISAIQEALRHPGRNTEEETVVIDSDPNEDCHDLYLWKAMFDSRRFNESQETKQKAFHRKYQSKAENRKDFMAPCAIFD